MRCACCRPPITAARLVTRRVQVRRGCHAGAPWRVHGQSHIVESSVVMRRKSCELCCCCTRYCADSIAGCGPRCAGMGSDGHAAARIPAFAAGVEDAHSGAVRQQRHVVGFLVGEAILRDTAAFRYSAAATCRPAPPPLLHAQLTASSINSRFAPGSCAEHALGWGANEVFTAGPQRVKLNTKSCTGTLPDKPTTLLTVEAREKGSLQVKRARNAGGSTRSTAAACQRIHHAGQMAALKRR